MSSTTATAVSFHTSQPVRSGGATVATGRPAAAAVRATHAHARRHTQGASPEPRKLPGGARGLAEQIAFDEQLISQAPSVGAQRDLRRRLDAFVGGLLPGAGALAPADRLAVVRHALEMEAGDTPGLLRVVTQVCTDAPFPEPDHSTFAARITFRAMREFETVMRAVDLALSGADPNASEPTNLLEHALELIDVMPDAAAQQQALLKLADQCEACLDHQHVGCFDVLDKIVGKVTDPEWRQALAGRAQARAADLLAGAQLGAGYVRLKDALTVRKPDRQAVAAELKALYDIAGRMACPANRQEHLMNLGWACCEGVSQRYGMAECLATFEEVIAKLDDHGAARERIMPIVEALLAVDDDTRSRPMPDQVALLRFAIANARFASDPDALRAKVTTVLRSLPAQHDLAAELRIVPVTAEPEAAVPLADPRDDSRWHTGFGAAWPLPATRRDDVRCVLEEMGHPGVADQLKPFVIDDMIYKSQNDGIAIQCNGLAHLGAYYQLKYGTHMGSFDLNNSADSVADNLRPLVESARKQGVNGRVALYVGERDGHACAAIYIREGGKEGLFWFDPTQEHASARPHNTAVQEALAASFPGLSIYALAASLQNDRYSCFSQSLKACVTLTRRVRNKDGQFGPYIIPNALDELQRLTVRTDAATGIHRVRVFPELAKMAQSRDYMQVHAPDRADALLRDSGRRLRQYHDGLEQGNGGVRGGIYMARKVTEYAQNAEIGMWSDAIEEKLGAKWTDAHKLRFFRLMKDRLRPAKAART